MIPTSQTTEDCLKEMFRRVGEDYPNPELTEHEDWYTLRTWTKDQEDDFRLWMKKLLKKRYKHWGQRLVDNEVGMFLLMWGWCVG